MANERYQRQKIVGQGPMSVVWLAQDTYTQKAVALKIMTAIAEDDQRNHKAYERFQRETAIALSLQHPYILPIIDYGEFEYDKRRVPFLVSPYIPDGSLADLIKVRPPWKVWSLLQTADALLQAAESLWYLHTRSPQIVHQDVKPGNFLVRFIQSPLHGVHLYLCDFGISRWQNSSTTMASDVIGTFAYMAPEQVARKVNCASDQYALAVMACHLLTGKLPIQATTNEGYAHAHLHNPPIPPSRLNPQRITTSAIDAVILRALEKSPGRRFASILQFAQELQSAIMLQETASAPTERLDLASVKTITRSEKFPQLLHPTPPPPRMKPAIEIVLDLPENDHEHILDEPLPGRPSKATPPSTRHAEFALTRLPLTHALRYDLPARPRTLHWSPDGNLLACTCYGHAPLLMYKNNTMQEVQTHQASQIAYLCWSPDSRTLAISMQGEIHFWDIGSQQMLPLVLKTNTRTIEGMSWSSQGQLALWIENQIRIYTLPRTSLTTLRAPVAQTLVTGAMSCGNTGTLQWSPDGTLLAAGGNNGGVLCWNVKLQIPAWQVAPPGQKVINLAWSPDGALLAVAFRDNRVSGWNVHTRMPAFQWSKLPAMPRTLSISTQRRIVLASNEKRLLAGLPNTPGPSEVIPGQLLAAWSPTRLELATLNEQSEISLGIWQEEKKGGK